MATNKVDFPITEPDFKTEDPYGDTKNKYIFPERHYVHVDSRDRDKAVYPKPNHYKIDFTEYDKLYE